MDAIKYTIYGIPRRTKQERGETAKVRILYVATSFPEPDKGSTIYTDLAEALHEAKHEVVVAVSEQAKNLATTQMSKERGLDVLRVVTGNYYDVGLIEKGITTLRIPGLMRKGIEEHLGERVFDVVLFESPPITNATLVSWVKKKFNCKAFLMLKDIFPQNAVDLGIMKKNGLLYTYFRSKEIALYETADIIGCMSPANKDYVVSHNPCLDPRKVELFPNTKRITDQSLAVGPSIRKKFDISEEACIFLFGGNMGRPQCIDLLCNAVTECKDDEKIFFLFVGRGTDRYRLEDTIRAENIRNAVVIENLPRDEYERVVKECDVGLIVLDPRFTIPNYPSRILSYMEYAKPILAATDRVTDLRNLIREAQCGNWVWSADEVAFVSMIRQMSRSNSLPTLGKNGREYVEKKFDVQFSVEILERHFD